MLVEYQKYKEIGEQLKRLEANQSRHFPVTLTSDQRNYDPELFLGDITLIDWARFSANSRETAKS